MYKFSSNLKIIYLIIGIIATLSKHGKICSGEYTAKYKVENSFGNFIVRQIIFNFWELVKNKNMSIMNFG